MKIIVKQIPTFCFAIAILALSLFSAQAQLTAEPAITGISLPAIETFGENLHESLFGNQVVFPTPFQLLPPPRPASPSNGAKPIILTGTTLPATQTLGDKYPYEVMYEAYEGAQIVLSVEFQFYDENSSVYKTIFKEIYASSGSGSTGSFQLTSVCMKATGIWPIRHVFALEDASGTFTHDVLEADVTCRESTVFFSDDGDSTAQTDFNGNFNLTISGQDDVFFHGIDTSDADITVLVGSDIIGLFSPMLPSLAVSAQGPTRSGFLKGKVSGRTLSGNWYQEPTYTGSDSGTFSFQLSSDGNSITGSWSGGGSTESVSGQRKGTSAPPSEVAPPSGGNSLADFDMNDNCALDDSEFFNAVDSWLSESIANSLFFDVLDAWIGQMDVCAATASLQISTQKTASGSMRFSVENAGASLIHIEIYDLQGSLMHLQSSSNGQLVWNMRSVNGKVVANGVYLYRVSVRNLSGDLVGSELRKFIVLR